MLNEKKAFSSPAHEHLIRGLSNTPVAGSPKRSSKKSQVRTANWRYCVLVSRLPTDRVPDDAVTDLIARFAKHRHFNWGRVPTTLAWLVVSPKKSEFIIWRWTRPDIERDRSAAMLCDEFCRVTGRTIAVIPADLNCHISTEKFSLNDCRLIHQDDLQEAANLKPAKRTLEKKTSIIEVAERLLRRRGKQQATIDEREFLTDIEAHDSARVNRLYAQFVKRVGSLTKELTKEIRSARVYRRRPSSRNSVQWNLPLCDLENAHRRLYVAAIHEDTELPIQLLMGTI